MTDLSAAQELERRREAGELDDVIRATKRRKARLEKTREVLLVEEVAKQELRMEARDIALENRAQVRAEKSQIDLEYVEVGLVELSEPDALIRTDGIGLLRSGGTLHLLFGDQNSGKSQLAAVLAVEQMRRGEVVVWLDWEMGKPRVMERLLMVGAEVGMPFLYGNMVGLPPGAAVEAIRDEAAGWFIIDSVSRALDSMGGDFSENDAKSFIALVNSIAPLLKYGVSGVLIDHTGHQDKTRARGSSAKAQQVDVSYSVEATKPWSREDPDGRIRITVRKDRDGFFGVGDIAAIGEVYATDTVLRPPTEMDIIAEMVERHERIMEYVGEHQPVRKTKVIESVRGRNVDIRQDIEDLLEMGYLVLNEKKQLELPPPS